MECKRISIRNFRNIEAAEIAFDSGVNILCGENAQGKTNLLEAVAFLGSGKSFRAQKNSEMIRFGADFADMDAKILSQGREQELRYVLFSGSRPRQIFRNGAKKKSWGTRIRT